jgi:hypothetical protein
LNINQAIQSQSPISPINKISSDTGFQLRNIHKSVLE